MDDSFERNLARLEELQQDKRKLLYALNQILNSKLAKCYCNEMFKCIFCHGHEVFMEVTNVENYSV